MILTYVSQQDYDAMAGKSGDGSSWSAQDFAAIGAFMHDFNQDLEQSGELVETRALAAPVHARRLSGRAAIVTNGPYAETEDVLAGYWIVECTSFDRATATLPRGPVGWIRDPGRNSVKIRTRTIGLVTRTVTSRMAYTANGGGRCGDEERGSEPAPARTR
ncbi:MAG: YciI family protein [Antricoccus sp.]